MGVVFAGGGVEEGGEGGGRHLEGGRWVREGGGGACVVWVSSWVGGGREVRVAMDGFVAFRFVSVCMYVRRRVVPRENNSPASGLSNFLPTIVHFAHRT